MALAPATALERSQGRVSELERKVGTLAEPLADLGRVRDAAIASRELDLFLPFPIQSAPV